MNGRSIITDSSLFVGSYIPSELSGRHGEVDQLRKHVLTLTKSTQMRHVWLHGPPGTGKTCAAKSILNEMEERHGIKGAYINCWEVETFFSILDKIVRDFRILGTEKLSTLYKLERLEAYLQKKPFLLVLDEIDKPSPRERDSIIYNLCGIPNVGLICLCNSRYFYFVLDSRVRSRLNALLIEFEPYTTEQMVEILRRRATAGLREGSFNADVLARLAKLSHGDARVGIQALKHAANYADVFSADRIQLDHIKGGLGIARNGRRKYVLAKLSDHHQLLHSIIQDFGEIRSGELWKEYLLRCKQAGMDAAASRTFTVYLKRLEDLKLIISTRALGVKGNVRIFRVRTG